jgi:rare lipoprotein A
MELAAGTPAKAPEAIATSSLPPLTGSAISDTPIPPPPGTALPAATPLRAAMATATPGLRVQAGAFSSEATAQRAVSQLAAAGPAAIEPVQRSDGLTLYRVVLPAPADEAEAYALRDRIAEIGFADARVVRTF